MDGLSVYSLVLAGGQSRRMGRDKTLLPVEPGTAPDVDILSRTIQTAATWSDGILVLGGQGVNRACVSGRPVTHIADGTLYAGPLAAIANAWGLTGADSGDKVVLLPGDVPGLHWAVIRTCIDVMDDLRRSDPHRDPSVLVCRDGKPQPLLGVYPPSAGARFMQLHQAQETRLMSVVAALDVHLIDTNALTWPEWWTRPVHTEGDYAEWLKEVQSDETRDSGPGSHRDDARS